MNQADASGELPVLFLDYNFGRKVVPVALRAAGARCEVHIDHFAQDAADEEWLPAVGKWGWIVITKDYNIGRKLNEIEALRNARVGAFVLASDGLTGPEMAEVLVRALPKIHAFILSHPKPFLAKFYKNGEVTAWR